MQQLLTSTASFNIVRVRFAAFAAPVGKVVLHRDSRKKFDRCSIVSFGYRPVGGTKPNDTLICLLERRLQPSLRTENPG